MANESNCERITYRELRDQLDVMDEKDLDCDVTICLDGEFYPALMLFSEGDDILDDGHPYFVRTDWNGAIDGDRDNDVYIPPNRDNW